MDIVDRLKSDHRTLKNFLEVMTDDGTSADARRRSLHHFESLYYAHTVAEEMVVYNALDGKGADWEDLSHIGHTEHKVATTMIARLLKMDDAQSEEWQHEAYLLRDIVDHHIDAEEAEMIPEVSAVFGAPERTSMVGRYDDAKKRALLERG
ncbi:MAG: hemerythrin domain-containing protein [Parasphingopyxis sp.]|uniref:hemerythrin domain-containing protein n=1 Tax=Parasphingopyxis sp. TaxID=1920299 RepID=UPI003F9F0D55